MKRRALERTQLTLVLLGLAGYVALQVLIAALLVHGLALVLHLWWAAIPPMSFGTSALITILLVLLVNVLEWLNFVRGAK